MLVAATTVIALIISSFAAALWVASQCRSVIFQFVSAFITAPAFVLVGSILAMPVFVAVETVDDDGTWIVMLPVHCLWLGGIAGIISLFWSGRSALTGSDRTAPTVHMTGARRPFYRRRQSQSTRRGAALYMTVAAVALMVFIMATCALTLVNIEHRHSTSNGDVLHTRINSRSAVDMAIARINADPNWRTTYLNGVETVPVTLGQGSTGTLSFVLRDTDGSLALPDTDLRLKGIGRIGDAVHVGSVGLSPVLMDVGPILFKAQTSFSDVKEEKIADDSWVAQYFLPSLPSDAVGWRVTSIELYLKPQGSLPGETIEVGIYPPAANLSPVPTAIDLVSIPAISFTILEGWKTVNLAGEYNRSPTAPACFAITTQNADPKIKINYREKNVTDANSAFSKSGKKKNWDFKAGKSDQALLYRVNGIYTKPTGRMYATPGTWQSEPSP